MVGGGKWTRDLFARLKTVTRRDGAVSVQRGNMCEVETGEHWNRWMGGGQSHGTNGYNKKDTRVTAFILYRVHCILLPERKLVLYSVCARGRTREQVGSERGGERCDWG